MSILRDYQEKAIQQIKTGWKEGDRRLMLQLPTGGGKTVVMTDLIRELIENGKRTMFIAHREELITQAWKTFHRSKIMSGVVKADVAPAPHFKSQVGSIQTMIRRKVLPAADVVFIDEAHHALDDNSYGQVIRTHYPNALILGVTATPYRLNGRGFTKVFDSLVETIQIGELIDRGFLVPFRYFVSSSPDLSGVQLKSGDYDINESAEAMKFAPLVQSYLDHARGLMGMVFAVNVEHSRQIVTNYNAEGFSAAHIDANTPSEDRRAIIQNFRDRNILILSNVGIATEGFDVPNMDFVQLARPTKSLSLFLQMVGRSSRVDNDVIKDAMSDEQRKFNISCSVKPNAIILDNAGLWLDHGLPDQSVDWKKYFVGVNKKAKDPWSEFIEIIQFIAEDAKGNRISTGIPSEIEGLKLIEIKHSFEERTENIGALKELDRNVEMLKRLPHINKVGYVAFKNFQSYCKKGKILMSSPIWEEVKRRLSDVPGEAIKKEAVDLARVIKALRATYANDPTTCLLLESDANLIYKRRVDAYNRILVSRGYLEGQEAEYITLDAMKVEPVERTVTNDL